MTNAPDSFDSAATTYEEARRRLLPPFDSFYETAVEAVAITGEPRRVLDLGAGTGLLSRKVREAFPEVELTLLDAAPRMLGEARDSLGTTKTDYVVGDFAETFPPGPWEAIVSALAIHHLEDEEKRDLFAHIHGELRPGGVFVNAEQVLGASRRFSERNRAWHESCARAAGTDDTEWDAAEQRMSLDRCATVEDQLSWLRAAGFSEVDCLFRHYQFAVLVAVR